MVWGGQTSIVYVPFLLNESVRFCAASEIRTLWLHTCIMYGGILQLAENAYTKWFIRSGAFLVEPTAMGGDEQESESQISMPEVAIAHIHFQQCKAELRKTVRSKAFLWAMIFMRTMLASFGWMSLTHTDDAVFLVEMLVDANTCSWIHPVPKCPANVLTNTDKLQVGAEGALIH